jgi:hypothetical protein
MEVVGNPAEGEVYGFASWNSSDATLMLRNPSSRSANFSFCLSDLLELPSQYEGTYRLTNIRTGSPEGAVKSKKEETIHLAPFEVKVIHASLIRTIEHVNQPVPFGHTLYLSQISITLSLMIRLEIDR